MQLISTNLLPVPVGSLHARIKDALPSQFGLKYCPAMDLVAVFCQTLPSEQALEAANLESASHDDYYGEDDDDVFVDVYRLNGQKVFTISIDSKRHTIGVIDISWRDDGVILAIVTSDNVVRLANSFSGKIIHTFSSMSFSLQAQSTTPSIPKSPSSKRKSASHDDGPVKRRCIPTSVHCSTHFSNPRTIAHQLEAVDEERGTNMDDLLSLNADIDQLLKVKANLPEELANIDVEQFLPKLATLPANGMGEDDVFSTRTSVDSIFHAHKQHCGSCNTHVVAIACSDAQVHLRVFDSFEVGDINLAQSVNMPSGCNIGRICDIVTHPLSGKMYVVAEEAFSATPKRKARTQDKANELGPTLHLLSLDLRFLEHSTHTLPTLATKATQLHNLIRYLRQIETQLAREIKVAFDLPSRFIRTLEEDLKEQDGEASTFETSAYHALLTSEVHGKFKEWLVEILGDRGVKRWDKAVSECLDLVRRLVSENWNPAVERAGIVVSRLCGLAASSGTFQIDRCILEALRETVDIMAVLGEDLLRDTNAEISGFNAFMKWLKREVEMASLEDTSEKLDEMRESSDHGDVRRVLKYISERLRDTSVKKYIQEQHSSTRVEEDHREFYSFFKQLRQDKKQSARLPTMKVLTVSMTDQCDRLFKQVASKLRESVLVQYECSLDEEIDSNTMCSRIIFRPEYAVLHVLGKHFTNDGQLCWSRRSLETTLSKHNVSTSRVVLDEKEEVLDIQFVDDQEVMLLAKSSTQMVVMSLGIANKVQPTIRHAFSGDGDAYTRAGLRPGKMELNGRRGRRTMTVLDGEGRGYGVFDLDSSATIDNGDDEAMSG